MKERAIQETRSTICLPLGINQKWERDSSLIAKDLGVLCVAQADGGQPRAFIAECLFVVAQLRDVLAAEDSSVVAKEGDHCGVLVQSEPSLTGCPPESGKTIPASFSLIDCGTTSFSSDSSGLSSKAVVPDLLSKLFPRVGTVIPTAFPQQIVS